MVRAFIVVFLIGVALYVVSTIGRTKPVTVVIAPVTQTASVVNAVVPYTNFSATGTLVFYPNNVEPVPYIFYQNDSGRTSSRALVFEGSPPANFSSWSGAHISVQGHLDNEHVVVSTITYVSGP